MEEHEKSCGMYKDVFEMITRRFGKEHNFFLNYAQDRCEINECPFTN